MKHLQSKEQFISGLPDEYREGQALLLRRIRELEARIRLAEGNEFDALAERLTILRSMLRHTIDVRQVIEHYYEPDAQLNPNYTLLARRAGGKVRGRRGYHFEGSQIDIKAGGKTREVNPPQAPNNGG